MIEHGGVVKVGDLWKESVDRKEEDAWKEGDESMKVKAVDPNSETACVQWEDGCLTILSIDGMLDQYKLISSEPEREPLVVSKIRAINKELTKPDRERCLIKDLCLQQIRYYMKYNEPDIDDTSDYSEALQHTCENLIECITKDVPDCGNEIGAKIRAETATEYQGTEYKKCIYCETTANVLRVGDETVCMDCFHGSDCGNEIGGE